ncbi:Hypothetical predicted protein [Paramuricea clavata]|uniref:Uncharacterized protein n=1 Tax=Paramuricea clavata TaxID=317549 RepID=A0A7D9ISA3_PARCT|nr:Hypothetical predicted protein [Paramuricea clavata]
MSRLLFQSKIRHSSREKPSCCPDIKLCDWTRLEKFIRGNSDEQHHCYNSSKTAQYNFQYIPDAEPDIVTLKDIEEKIEAGSKVRVKSVVKKGEAVKKVGSKNL